MAFAGAKALRQMSAGVIRVWLERSELEGDEFRERRRYLAG